MNKKTIFAVSAAVVASVAAVMLFKTHSPSSEGEVRVEVPADGGSRAIEEFDSDTVAGNVVGRRRKAVGTNDVANIKWKRRRAKVPVEDAYTPEERQLSDGLQSASDENDLGKVRKAVAEIMSQKNAELKEEAISALRFFGKDALTDLMAFLKDPSQDVVDSATDAISSALDELDDEENAFKAEFVSMLLSVDGLCGKDAIGMLAGQLEGLGASDEKLAVQTIVQLMEDGNVGDGVKARLREAYEFVTSEEYTTLEAAEKWYRQKLDEEAAEADDGEDAADEPQEDVKDDEDDDNDEDDGNQEGVQT